MFINVYERPSSSSDLGSIRLPEQKSLASRLASITRTCKTFHDSACNGFALGFYAWVTTTVWLCDEVSSTIYDPNRTVSAEYCLKQALLVSLLWPVNRARVPSVFATFLPCARYDDRGDLVYPASCDPPHPDMLVPETPVAHFVGSTSANENRRLSLFPVPNSSPLSCIGTSHRFLSYWDTVPRSGGLYRPEGY
ncbi:hypothetical protein EDD22DRAFT_64414 [Suillus occidentalis]|nr:hypothetical protein EDD22DRAFT_64414 [Suillus occidentalis]